MGHGPRQRKAPSARFWQLVDVRPTEPRACWRWRGAVAADTGYGVFNDGDKAVLAHIFSFTLTRPTLDRTGLVVRHTCDTPLCVNPHHLVLGTHKANTKDMDERGRRVNNPVKGEAHYAAKLTAEWVREARILYRQYNYPIAELARRFGSSESAMKAAIEGRTWKHVK